MTTTPESIISKRTPPVLTVPYLNQPQTGLTFGRLDSDYHVESLVLQIENQETLPRAVWAQIQSLLTVNMLTTEPIFVSVWKHIMLKRAQDVYRQFNNVRPADMISLPRAMTLPAPLFDLVNSPGVYHSKVTGCYYQVVPPTKPEKNPEEFWTVDQHEIMLFQHDMNRNVSLYQMHTYPDRLEYDDRPLLLTTLEGPTKRDPNVRVRSFTDEPQPSDAIVRIVNDDLFAPHNYITSTNCNLLMTYKMLPSHVRDQYVGSYVLSSNS